MIHLSFKCNACIFIFACHFLISICSLFTCMPCVFSHVIFFSMINLYSQGIMHGSQDVACIFFVKFRVYHVQMHLHMFFHASTYYSYYSQIFMLRVHNQSCVNARSVLGIFPLGCCAKYCFGMPAL